MKLVGRCQGRSDCPFNFVSFVPNLDYKMHQIKHRLNTAGGGAGDGGGDKTLLLRSVS